MSVAVVIVGMSMPVLVTERMILRMGMPRRLFVDVHG